MKTKEERIKEKVAKWFDLLPEEEQKRFLEERNIKEEEEASTEPEAETEDEKGEEGQKAEEKQGEEAQTEAEKSEEEAEKQAETEKKIEKAVEEQKKEDDKTIEALMARIASLEDTVAKLGTPAPEDKGFGTPPANPASESHELSRFDEINRKRMGR